MKTEPNKMLAEVKIDGQWVLVEECLPFAEHERNASSIGATEVRSLDGKIHSFLKQLQ